MIPALCIAVRMIGATAWLSTFDPAQRIYRWYWTYDPHHAFSRR